MNSSDAPTPSDFPKPEYREAQVVTEEYCAKVFDSGNTEAIHYALIDGSRCLEDAWGLHWGIHFLNHSDAQVRWGAVFALEQARCLLVDTLDDDFDIIFSIGSVASDDPDSAVRSMASHLLVQIIGSLRRRKTN